MATRKSHILFIGFGHLAKSLLSPNLRKNYLIHYINSKKSICSVKDKKVIKNLDYNYDYIFLLIRPDVFKKIGGDFQFFMNNKPTIISCMAGVSTSSISQKLNSKKVIRIMPNIMAKKSLSQTYIYSKNKKIIDKNFKDLISSFGSTIFTNNEDDINVATAVFGSGPAFIAYIINTYLIAAKKLSSKSKIKDFDLIKLFQNVLELNNSSEDLDRFVMAIASKKGTTQAGVRYLKSQNIKKTIYTTLDRAYKRAKELSVEKKSTK